MNMTRGWASLWPMGRLAPFFNFFFLAFSFSYLSASSYSQKCRGSIYFSVQGRRNHLKSGGAGLPVLDPGFTKREGIT